MLIKVKVELLENKKKYAIVLLDSNKNTMKILKQDKKVIDLIKEEINYRFYHIYNLVSFIKYDIPITFNLEYKVMD